MLDLNEPDKSWQQTKRQQNWTDDEPQRVFRQKASVLVERTRQLTLDETND